MSIAMTPMPTGAATSNQTNAFVPRELHVKHLWMLFGVTTLMIVGLQLDAYAHSTQPERNMLLL